MQSRPASHVERLLRDRGQPIETKVLPFTVPAQEDDQHRHEQPSPPPPPDEPTVGYPEKYKVMSLGPAGHAPRLWLKGRFGELFPSLPWNPLPAIFADLDRETHTIPQSIEIHSMRGVARIEGFNLDALAEKLNAQYVAKVYAFCEKRWPGTTFRQGEPKVTKIRWTWFDDEMEEKAQRTRDKVRLHLVEPGTDPER